MKSDDLDVDLMNHWFESIGTTRNMYKQPIVDAETAKFLKEACDIFDQDTHVFVLALEICEDYVQAKADRGEPIRDHLLAFVAAVFVAHKSEGAPESLKVQHVLDLLHHFADRPYRPGDVVRAEADVLGALRGQLPLGTVAHDLDLLVERHAKEMKLAVSVRPLCMKILEVLYIERNVWFYELKAIYEQSNSPIGVFQGLLTSKFFLPVSILIAAFGLCQYRHILSLEAIIKDISEYSLIHVDHLQLMAAKIIEIVS